MHLPRFRLLQPKSIEHAAELLAQSETAIIMAGGTDVLPRMKYGLELPESVVGLSNLPVQEPVDFDGTLRLDSLMTLAEVTRAKIIRQNAHVLAEAAHAVASYQIRNMATLGGNLCLETRCLYYNQSHTYQFVEPCFKRNGDRCYFIPKGKKCWAVSMGDISPALFSLDATVEVLSNGKLNLIPIDQLYTRDALNPVALSKRDLLVAVRIPKHGGLRGTAFSKTTVRGGLEFAAVNVAVVLDVHQDGLTCSSARISVGSVAAAPVRLKETESMLKGQELSDDLFNDTGVKAADEIRPIPHHGFSVPYLKRCVRFAARDALASAYSRI